MDPAIISAALKTKEEQKAKATKSAAEDKFNALFGMGGMMGASSSNQEDTAKVVNTDELEAVDPAIAAIKEETKTEEVKEKKAPEPYVENPNRKKISKNAILNRFKLVKEMDFSVFKDSTLVDFVDLFNSSPIVPESEEKTDKPAEGSSIQSVHQKQDRQQRYQ